MVDDAGAAAPAGLRRGGGRHRRGGRARRARSHRRPGTPVLRQGGRSGPARPTARRGYPRRGTGADGRRGGRTRARMRRPRRRTRSAVREPGTARALGRQRADPRRTAPARYRFGARHRHRRAAGRADRNAAADAGATRRRTGTRLGLRPACGGTAELDQRRLHQAVAPGVGGGPPPSARDHGAHRGRRRPGGHLPRARAASDRRTDLRSGRPRGPGRGRARQEAAKWQPGHVRGIPDRAGRGAPGGRPDRTLPVNAVTVAAGAVQLVGGVVLAPLLPGLVQHWKARLQGRRGPTPVQPYRDLRRLWGKSAVAVEGTSVVYRLAPSVVAASLGAAVLLVPVAAQAPDWGLGHDVLVLVGLLALARFAVAASSWDTGNGFSLMGASRDLTLSAFVEGTLLVSLAVATLVTGTTDLRAMIAGSVGGAWSSPLLAIGAVPFAMVVLAETGRQPVDNPDTHLELTMIHEGPLLEYAGRDLAYLQWAIAARHWVVLVIAAQIFLPHPGGPWWQLGILPVALGLLCGLLAVTETLVAKMRLLEVPRLLAVGALVALLGIAARLAGIA
ncbi:MAG: hypothetical protein E6F99_22280 [Actinobacteria bacterium]|nr:MAG: hypothetical protein E6F99_22280 [Actinomycetota bacterium]